MILSISDMTLSISDMTLSISDMILSISDMILSISDMTLSISGNQHNSQSSLFVKSILLEMTSCSVYDGRSSVHRLSTTTIYGHINKNTNIIDTM
jgi:hypothetical protein